jgi:hypothetical protein
MTDEAAPADVQQWVIGWRERVSLPDLGIKRIAAKIDSGALTSALHAVDIEDFREDGKRWVTFTITSAKSAELRCRLPLVDRRPVKNTSGVWASRFFVETRLLMGDRSWPIEISLADREQMGFDLILGRTAIRDRNILIDPDRSMLAGPPKQKKVRQAPKSSARKKQRDLGAPTRITGEQK